MGLKVKECINYIETLINVFTIENGKVKVLLFRKKTDPYKGYWLLPGEMVKSGDALENTISDVVYDKIGLTSLYIEQSHIFSKCVRDNDELVISVSYIGLIDSKSAEIKREDRIDYESKWFPIDSLPKLAFNHENIIDKAVEQLQNKIINTNFIKKLFPGDFTLPEIQSVYEQLLGKKMDRRNFRKKFINLGIVKPTGNKSEGGLGRPATLYIFRDEFKERNLF